MNKREALILRELNEHLSRLLRGDFSPVRPISAEASELQTLADSITLHAHLLADAQYFISALSQGKLDVDPPGAIL